MSGEPETAIAVLGSPTVEISVTRRQILLAAKIVPHFRSHVNRLPAGESMSRLFGDKLAYLRRARSWTQADLSRYLGAKPAHINNLEAGRRAPSLALVLHTAELFGVTTDYLLLDVHPVEPALPYSSVASPKSESSGQLFGPKLRHLRKLHHVTQIDLVQRLGLRSQSHISLMEAGQNEPSIDMIVQLADLFGVTTDYLLREPPASEETSR